MKSNTRIMALDRRVSAAMALAAAAALILLLFTGCDETPNFYGQDIKFQAGANPETKTVYGEIIGETGNRTQRVDWISGDLIRISCAAVSEPSAKYADYKVTSVLDPVTGDPSSKAKISLSGNGSTIGLRWGSSSAAHTFYGIYPSPATGGKSADSIDKDGKVSGTIPALQTYKSISSAAPYVAQPDMTSQYMVAKTTKPAGSQTIGDDEVFLWFTPITTAIEFTIKNNFADASSLDIKGISVISENHNLSGSFSTDLSAWTGTGSYPAVTAATGAAKTASIGFAPLSLAKDEELTFTMFLLPEEDLDDLTLKIVRTDDTWLSAKIARSETETISFDRCKKHFLKGILVEDGVKWTMEFTSEVVSWKTGKNADAEIYDQNNYVFEVNGSTDWTSMVYNNTTATQAQTLTVTSYTSPKDDDATKSAVPFDAMYSIDGGATWSSFNASSAGAAINGLYGLAGTNNTGSVDGLDYTLTAAARTASYPGSHGYWVGDNGDWSPENWYGKDIYGGSFFFGDTVRLNHYDFRTDNPDAFKQSTANCYIIRHSGKYCLPMVYGNSQLQGSNNKKAYWFGNQGTGALGNCLDFNGNPIANPIIAEDLGIVTDYGSDGSKESLDSQVKRTLGRFQAEVLWCDAGSIVIKNLSIIKALDFGWNGYYHAAHGIYFEVDPATVCQCNAVIALKDASNGRTIWSWHIWITNNPAVANPVCETIMGNGRIVDYFPMPAIGYKDGTVYFGRPRTIVKLRQQRSGKELLLTVNQTDVSEGSSVMYYQHGRKDPFRASAAFGSLPALAGNDIVKAVLSPGILATGWNDGGYSNLWTGAYSTPGSLVVVNEDIRKTIYDPSPRGFRVSAQKELEPFTADNRRLGEFSKGQVFKLSDEDKDGIFFGAYGYKTSGSDLTGNESTGMFWTSVPESSSYGGTFEFNSSSAALPVNIPLSSACPVRPVADPNFVQ